MAQFWQTTQILFTQIGITSPPLIEKYLRRPSPKYIFNLIINSMEKTGFPKDLFTKEETEATYFISSIEHKKEFFTKVIDITKSVTNSNFNIDVLNILKGLEAENTNKFLQMFHKASQTKEEVYKPIIQKYMEKNQILMEDRQIIKENDAQKQNNEINTIKVKIIF